MVLLVILLSLRGYNIGIRLVDEFLAKSGIGACAGFRETAEVIARLGLRMFLGVSAEVASWDSQEKSCSLILTENPLTDFVELPPALANLNYSNIICGVIRGALEQLRMRVSCYFVKDMLKGDDVYEIRLELKELMKEEFEDDDDL
ncbi:trafficking protein particle complex subunit [Cyclospora cayetanensis]|uniref:Trafficking protein particle complex subunit n=1 Tax=Cyclospora cayetanensis TaxID=88456 RepID=A0A1D3D0Q9_9EIME|nr:trafficking protein particle complex subunit [Cyclospora cayetanensis]